MWALQLGASLESGARRFIPHFLALVPVYGNGALVLGNDGQAVFEAALPADARNACAVLSARARTRWQAAGGAGRHSLAGDGALRPPLCRARARRPHVLHRAHSKCRGACNPRA